MMSHKLFQYAILSCVTCIACIACTDLENESAVAEAGDSCVRFALDTSSPATTSRAAVTTDETFDRMGVFGYSHSITTGWAGTASGSLLPDYFLNKMVWKDADDGTWRYDGVVKYWPDPARSVSFFAYAPYVDNQGTFVVTPKADTESGSPTITYTVPNEVAKQVDLVYDKKLNQTYSTASGIVKFQMQHALSQIDVSVRLNPDDQSVDPSVTVEITAVRLVNIYNKGTLTFADATPWVVDKSSITTYTLDATNGSDATLLSFDSSDEAAFSYRQLNAESNGHLMLIPQTLSSTEGSEAKLEVDYILHKTDADENASISYDLTSQTWEAGSRYNYQLTISLAEPAVLESVSNCYMIHPNASKAVTMNIPLSRINEYWDGNTSIGHGTADNKLNVGDTWTASILWSDITTINQDAISTYVPRNTGSYVENDYFTVTLPPALLQRVTLWYRFSIIG
ncbi:MAG: fimbrillin family protein [Prevotellaceae bacterium]|nr:fimbrillin family protein [Prevotellaceae bacterium]